MSFFFEEHPNGTLLPAHTKGIMYLKLASEKVSLLRFTQFMTAVLKILRTVVEVEINTKELHTGTKF